MPVEVLLASVVCKTLVSPARKVGLHLQDLLHVLVARCITRALHTGPIRHRLLRCIDFGFLQRPHCCKGAAIAHDCDAIAIHSPFSNPVQTLFAVDSTGRVDGHRVAVLRNRGTFAAIRVRVYHFSISSTL